MNNWHKVQEDIDYLIDTFADAHDGQWPSPDICKYADDINCQKCRLKTRCGNEPDIQRIERCWT